VGKTRLTRLGSIDPHAMPSQNETKQDQPPVGREGTRTGWTGSDESDGWGELGE